MNLTAMVDLVKEEMCQHRVNGVRALLAFNCGPVDSTRERHGIETVAECDQLSIRFELGPAEGRQVCVQLGVTWNQRSKALSGEPAEVPPIDQKDVVQRAMNRTEEAAPIASILRLGELGTCVVESAIAPLVVAGHAAKVSQIRWQNGTPDRLEYC